MTQILKEDIDGGGRRLTFFTGSPVVAAASQTGTAVHLSFSPCRMAVLFEDAFFESMDFTRLGDEGLYTLILPVGAGRMTLGLDCLPDRVVLTLMPGEDAGP